MKTTKILTILSLAILFAISSTGNANGVDTRNKQGSAMPSVTFQVSIHLSGLTKDICNPYIIQIIDENGRIVAPAQVFNPSTTKYVFREKTPVTGKTRIAVLMPVRTAEYVISPKQKIFLLQKMKPKPLCHRNRSPIPPLVQKKNIV